MRKLFAAVALAALLAGPALAAPPPATIANSAGAAVGVQPATAPVDLAYKNITSATTTTVVSGAGVLHDVTVNTLVGGATITLYDSLSGSGTKIGTITLPGTITSAEPFTVHYDVNFATGLTVVTSGATDLTVSAR